MVEVSEVFQQPKFQSLCHGLLLHCRLPFVFCLCYFKQTVILVISIQKNIKLFVAIVG